MDRRIVYIIVIALTIVLIVSDYFINKDLSAVPPVPIETEGVKEISDEEFEEIYKSSAILAPLTLKNYQNDNEIIVYTYNIKINEIQGAYRYTLYDSNNSPIKESYLVFAANGEGTIKLNSNESIIIYNLPTDVNYKIEQYATLGDKYTTKVANTVTSSYEGVISLDNNVYFVNETTNSKKESINIYEEKEDNPTTEDNHEKHILYLMISITIFLAISSIKVKRFE